MVATEDGRQDRVEWVLFAEEVCNEGYSVRVDGGNEELLKSLNTQSSSPLGKGSGDVHLRKSVPQSTSVFRR